MKRNKIEKQEEVKKIITKLTELKLTIIYDPIKQLFNILKDYVKNDKDIKINIPFPEIHKTIEGYLPINKNREVMVKLTNSK
jgi:hypothetical protein|uniref:Uncharacterized protein n=1 Tax=viral metagenome TaxID=1070528 RepID=A0A6C0AG71_9ZZZZ|tara:strand:- start:309 stop:554 length:246 start_codon:yes stop_codon:yes gene_type:complete